MRALFVVVMAVISAAAQTALVRLVNANHPASNTFQVGDRFEILITGAPRQQVSVRTTMNGNTDWGPVVATTAATGRWSTAGQFEKSDFGDWNEIWTIGSKLASPAVHFSVNAPCLPGKEGGMFFSGQIVSLTCETAGGRQTFRSRPHQMFFELRAPDWSLDVQSCDKHRICTRWKSFST